MDSLSQIEIKLLQAALPLFSQMKPFDDYEGEGNAPYWLNFWNHLRFSSEGDIGDVSASLPSVTTVSSQAPHPTATSPIRETLGHASPSFIKILGQLPESPKETFLRFC